jgi:hypothetical protein
MAANRIGNLPKVAVVVNDSADPVPISEVFEIWGLPIAEWRVGEPGNGSNLRLCDTRMVCTGTNLCHKELLPCKIVMQTILVLGIFEYRMTLLCFGCVSRKRRSLEEATEKRTLLHGSCFIFTAA